MFSGTVIKFCYVHILSKSGSSQMQHLQHNFKVNYWFNTFKLCEDYFEFQNRSTRKLTYKESLLLNVRPWVLKSPQSRSLDVVVEFNFEWITLAVKQISGITKKTFLGYKRTKYTNVDPYLHRFMFRNEHWWNMICFGA